MVDESPEVIKSQMEQTRQNLVEKIETLEQQVAQTVQDATSVVTSTVDTVKEVVNNTTDAVQSTVETVKDTLDISGHVQRSPWLMFGGAVMSGFALGKLVPPPQMPSTETYFRPEPREQPQQPSQEASSSPLSALGSFFEKPLAVAEGMAVSAFFSLLHSVVRDAVPADWKNQLLGMVDDMNHQLGGLPIANWNGGSSKGEKSPRNDKGDGDHAERNGPEVAGSVGATDRQGEESVGPVHRRRIDPARG